LTYMFPVLPALHSAYHYLLHILCLSLYLFFFHITATPKIYTLSLHDALPIYPRGPVARPADRSAGVHGEHRPLRAADARLHRGRSAFGPHLRLRHRRGLPALPRARRARLRRLGRRAAHGRVDQRRVGALDRHAIDL